MHNGTTTYCIKKKDKSIVMVSTKMKDQKVVKATLVAELLLKGEVENICRRLIQKAITGNIKAIKPHPTASNRLSNCT